MKTVVITGDKPLRVLADALMDAEPETVIIVHSERRKQIAQRAATRMNKTVMIEVVPDSVGN